MEKKSCLICSRQTQNYLYICPSCLELFSPKAERVVKEFSYVDQAFACFYYGSLLRDSITSFKFYKKRYLGKVFGELLTDKIFYLGLNKKVDLVIPVPIHKKTLVERGFNQVELLADEISANTKLQVDAKNLIKTRVTKEQARLDRSSRATNLVDSFALKRPELIKDKNILLLDDVITTGSTVEECAKLLKNAGAKKVYALSIATSH